MMNKSIAIRKQTNEKFISKTQDFGEDNVSCKNTFSNIIQDEVEFEEDKLFTKDADSDHENTTRDENKIKKGDLLRWALSQGWCRSNSDIIDLL